MCYIMSIMMSIICFSWCSYLQRLLPQHQCESVFAYYQVVIVSLDCSSDIQQIKLKGDILSLVTRSLREKGLMCWMLIVYIISVLKVTGEVCRVCGCCTIWGAFIYCITGKNDCIEMLCFIIYNFCIFPLSSVHISLISRFIKSICHYIPLCSMVNMWIKLKHDGIHCKL